MQKNIWPIFRNILISMLDQSMNDLYQIDL